MEKLDLLEEIFGVGCVEEEEEVADVTWNCGRDNSFPSEEGERQTARFN